MQCLQETEDAEEMGVLVLKQVFFCPLPAVGSSWKCHVKEASGFREN